MSQYRGLAGAHARVTSAGAIATASAAVGDVYNAALQEHIASFGFFFLKHILYVFLYPVHGTTTIEPHFQ